MAFGMTREPLSRTSGGRRDVLCFGVVGKQSWIPGLLFLEALQRQSILYFQGYMEVIVDIELHPAQEDAQQTQHMLTGGC